MEAPVKKSLIRIAVLESDPARLVGFPALFHWAQDCELISSSLTDVGTQKNIDLLILDNRSNQSPLNVMATLRATRPNLRIIVIGSGQDDETVLKAIAFGAKGYVDAAASSAELMQAIRIVNQGSVWAPRRVLSLFVERVRSAPDPISYAGRLIFTDREREVLLMLVAGRSNKEIGYTLGIGEQSVKAHVSKLLRKNRVPNRIALSVLAVTRSLVFSLQLN